MPVPPNAIPILIAIPLIAWRLYARVRRSVGRQTFSRVRPWVTICLFTLLITWLGIAAAAHPLSISCLVGGVAGGIALGVFGLAKTKFEQAPEGLFYTPNAHLGIALTVLFAGRVFYRLFVLYSMDPNAQPTPADFAQSPITLAIFGLLAGYYITYAIGLVRWARGVAVTPPATTNDTEAN